MVNSTWIPKSRSRSRAITSWRVSRSFPDTRTTSAWMLAWNRWRKSKQWHEWNAAIAPAVAARRRCVALLGDKQAVRVLFDEIAPRFVDRPGGYTRIVRLASPRLGDAGTRAILELVGVRDRVIERAVRPTFEGETAEAEPAAAK